MDDTVKKLEARIVELEQRLGQMPRRSEPENISAEELRAYQKVRAQIAADWGDECGLTECLRCLPASYRCFPVSFRCIPASYRCINECGPIFQGGGSFGGLGGSSGGFGGFGG